MAHKGVQLYYSSESYTSVRTTERHDDDLSSPPIDMFFTSWEGERKCAKPDRSPQILKKKKKTSHVFDRNVRSGRRRCCLRRHTRTPNHCFVVQL